MVFLFYLIDLSIRPWPWPGTHEPPSASERVAQRFERSENALDVVAGLSIIGLPPYHSVWCICFILRNFYPNRPWPGTHEPPGSTGTFLLLLSK